MSPSILTVSSFKSSALRLAMSAFSLSPAGFPLRTIAPTPHHAPALSHHPSDSAFQLGCASRGHLLLRALNYVWGPGQAKRSMAFCGAFRSSRFHSKRNTGELQATTGHRDLHPEHSSTPAAPSSSLKEPSWSRPSYLPPVLPSSLRLWRRCVDLRARGLQAGA